MKKELILNCSFSPNIQFQHSQIYKFAKHLGTNEQNCKICKWWQKKYKITNLHLQIYKFTFTGRYFWFQFPIQILSHSFLEVFVHIRCCLFCWSPVVAWLFLSGWYTRTSCRYFILASISDAPSPTGRSGICKDAPKLWSSISHISGLLSHSFGSYICSAGWEGELVVVGVWVVVVEVVANLYFQHCLDCCRIHLHLHLWALCRTTSENTYNLRTLVGIHFLHNYKITT
jgi:hypothetical protein